jgi:hypothetical protein
MSVPTLVAKKASLFQGRRYPVNPNVRERKRRMAPDTHVISLGRRNDRRKRVLNMWIKAVATMRLAE